MVRKSLREEFNYNEKEVRTINNIDDYEILIEE